MALKLDDLPLLTMIRERMSWLSARQSVLAENVANADLPGYHARDLKPLDFNDLLKGSNSLGGVRGGIAVTDPRHISPSPLVASSFAADDAAEASPGGSSVSLEQEMIKVANTQAEYQTASNLYAKAIDMMKLAIGH